MCNAVPKSENMNSQRGNGGRGDGPGRAGGDNYNQGNSRNNSMGMAPRSNDNMYGGGNGGGMGGNSGGGGGYNPSVWNSSGGRNNIDMPNLQALGKYDY